ncbi:carboxypeptidase-like regulatory domain-containing protein [bacterium]|nr:carboxypeptidase-like regulatory domain-containing protein [bacterium]
MSCEIKFCSENWDSMPNADQGRLCSACHKTVEDMRSKSWKQIFKLKRESENFVCGAYSSAQVRDIHNGNYFKGFKLGRIASLALITTGALAANAQSLQFTPEIETDSIPNTDGNSDEIRSINYLNFQVLDSASGDSLPYIMVRIEGSTEGTYSDHSGYVHLRIPEGATEATIVLSYLGVQDTFNIDMTTRVVYWTKIFEINDIEIEREMNKLMPLGVYIDRDLHVEPEDEDESSEN